MHSQPHTSRPRLTMNEAIKFYQHHVIKATEAYVARDERMRRFHQMRANYLSAVIKLGVPK